MRFSVFVILLVSFACGTNASGPNAFVIYRPDSPSDIPYVNLWAEVQDFVSEAQGAITVYLQQPVGTDYLLIPGSLNGLGRAIVRPATAIVSSLNTVNVTTILFQDGIVFTDIAEIFGPLEIQSAATIAVPFQFSLHFTAILFDLSVRFVRLEDATLPFIYLASGLQLVVLADIGVEFDTRLSPGQPIFELEASDDLATPTMLQIVCRGPVLTSDNIILGDNTTVFFHVHDSASGRLVLANFTGTYNEALLDAAEGTTYEDWRQQPSFFVNRAYPSSPGPTVAQVLDVVKIRLPIVYSIASTTLGTNTFWFLSPVQSAYYAVVFSQTGNALLGANLEMYNTMHNRVCICFQCIFSHWIN